MITTGIEVLLRSGDRWPSAPPSSTAGAADGGLAGGSPAACYGGVGEHTGYIVLVVAGARRAVPRRRRRSRSATPTPTRSRRSPALDELPEAARAAHRELLAGPRRFGRRASPSLGLVVSPCCSSSALIVGIVVLSSGWCQAWSERATGDPEVNRAHPQPADEPDRDPAVRRARRRRPRAVVSRACCSPLSKNGAVGRRHRRRRPDPRRRRARTPTGPKVGRNVVAVAAACSAALGVIAGGIIGAAERARATFEKHEAEHEPAQPDRRQHGDARRSTTPRPATAG